MTNSSTQQDTKRKIIDAAYKVLGEQGYDKTSMKQIAKEAGVAQGLINYYFPSKDDLLFECFREETNRYCQTMERIDDIPLTPNFVREALRIPYTLVEEHPEWHRLRFELFAIGLRTEAGLKEIAHSMKEGRDTAIRATRRLPIGPGINKEALASVVVALLDGLSLQKMSDPEFDAKAAYEEAAKLIETYIAANLQTD